MTSPNSESVTLQPRPWVPLAILLLAAPLALWRWPVAALVGLFGLFLLLQTVLLRLRFEAEALVVLRQTTEIRRFPYAQWQAWRLFWGPLPLLFYFREVNSPHLLPVLFNASELRQQLELRLPALNP